MTKTIGYRDGVISAIVFGAILFALISVDERVKQQAMDVFHGSSVTSLSGRVGDLSGALMSAARDKSLDNAPLLIFATVGTVLTLFMLKS
jgi:hypothetical protein